MRAHRPTAASRPCFRRSRQAFTNSCRERALFTKASRKTVVPPSPAGLESGQAWPPRGCSSMSLGFQKEESWFLWFRNHVCVRSICKRNKQGPRGRVHYDVRRRCYVHVVMSTETLGPAALKRTGLSEEPAIHPTAHVRDSRLGSWTIGRRPHQASRNRRQATTLHRSDASMIYTEVGKFCSIARRLVSIPAITRSNASPSITSPIGAGTTSWAGGRSGILRRDHKVVPGSDVWVGHGAGWSRSCGPQRRAGFCDCSGSAHQSSAFPFSRRDSAEAAAPGMAELEP